PFWFDCTRAGSSAHRQSGPQVLWERKNTPRSGTVRCAGAGRFGTEKDAAPIKPDVSGRVDKTMVSDPLDRPRSRQVRNCYSSQTQESATFTTARPRAPSMITTIGVLASAGINFRPFTLDGSRRGIFLTRANQLVGEYLHLCNFRGKDLNYGTWEVHHVVEA